MPPRGTSKLVVDKVIQSPASLPWVSVIGDLAIVSMTSVTTLLFLMLNVLA
ncbi:MAG: hypothetical protein DDT26_02645 [Dehalococcoidia bacterium]|nr:hypothetical protein [Chloroflexota bacterium]